jgi:cell division protein FtsL
LKHLLKFYQKGTAFLMAFCLMALLFSFSCAAAENTTTYRFSDINLEVQVPSELIGFTRSVTSNNAYLDLIGTDDVEELRSLMVVNHVYLEAVPQDVRYELIISGKEAGSASTDFTELSDTDLDSLFNEYLQKSDAIDNESVTENITASAIEHVNGIPYFVTSVKSVANNQVTVYMKKYYTVMQGNAISFFIQSNGEEIDSATAQLLTEVVTSAQYKTIHKSILENAFFTEILASVVTLAVPILLLALIVYLVEKSKKKTKKQIEADEKRLRAEYARQEAEAAKKVQEASGETEVSETGISENETSGGQNGNNYQ